MAFAVLGVAGCRQDVATTTQSSAATSSATITEVADAIMARTAEQNPYVKFRRGELVTDLPDWSLEAAEENAAFARQQLERLATVDEDHLTHDEWLTLETLRWDLGLAAEAASHYWADFNVTPYAAGGFALDIVHQVIGAAPHADQEDHARYLHLLDEYGRIIGQLAEKVEGQSERGIYLPKAQVPPVRQMFEGYRARSTELFVPSAERLEGVDGSEPAELRVAIEDAVERAILPAFDRLLAALGDAYLEAAPEQVGLGVVPGGRELYLYRVRANTTTNLSPEEIHAIGQAEVARLEAEMAEIRREIGFEGSGHEFLNAVRRDARFIAQSPEEVEERYMGYITRIEPLVDDYFDVLPAAPYGVRRLDETVEATMTFGVYQPPTTANPRGEYRYNGSDLPNRSLFSAQGLIYHELIPGHHFQIALQNENKTLHPYRQQALYTAFTEGWAEYAANLGKEMGLYSDPYDRYGRLVMEMFISCRLVLDTGMNHLGWTLEEARDFMTPRVVYSDVEIATELLRYSADIHGQALGYRIGYLEIARLRKKAEEALGDAFDLKAFHAAVIGSGAMPMVVLEKHVDWWIDQQQNA